jgi:DNA polymerase III epsilon subunit-like protein
MSLKEQLLAAAEQVLATESAGLTVEALARQVSQRVGRQMPPRQVADALRSKPERFLEGGDGRWRLRERPGILSPEDEPDAPAESGPPRPNLRRGCFVVFDLEATGPSPESLETELLQIAARRFIDGVPDEVWMTYVRPADGTVPAQITVLTSITREQVRNAPDAAEALRQFFAHVGELPLIAHNGATFDGPLIEATCRRLGVSLSPTFRVLDTLPLARVLLPCLRAHRVEVLAQHFGCHRAGAHQADVDVQMLGDILDGLQRLIHEGPTGWAVYELLRRSGDPWADLLTPPAGAFTAADVIACFGARLVPLLPARAAFTATTDLLPEVGNAYARAEALGRSRRLVQQELSRLAAERFMQGGIAAIEAGTGTGKSQGYLIPAALAARSGGLPVAVSTFTRVLQNQLVERELPFVQQLIPDLTFAQLQGRCNYLSLSRLAEEVEDALSEARLSLARAWTLALLVRFAEASVHGNLEELGYLPQSLDDFLAADGGVWQVIASVRASIDDPPAGPGQPDFYARARANAERADVVVVNHALLLYHRQAQRTLRFIARQGTPQANVIHDYAAAL